MGLVVLSRITAEVSGDVRIGYVVSDLEGDSLSYRFRYRFDSVWVDADVEYVGM